MFVFFVFPEYQTEKKEKIFYRFVQNFCFSICVDE